MSQQAGWGPSATHPDAVQVETPQGGPQHERPGAHDRRDRPVGQVPRAPQFCSPCWKVLASGLPSGWGWPHCTRLAGPVPMGANTWHHSGPTLGHAFFHKTHSASLLATLTSPKSISSNSSRGSATPGCSPEPSHSMSTPLLGSVLSLQSIPPSLSVCLSLCRRPGCPNRLLLPHHLDWIVPKLWPQ